MRKALFIFALVLLAATASAQLKVAILEPVDRDQNVSYGIKLLLRSSLTSAISNTPGYEGYDRVDMASIAGEQEFQRTGNVSDNQIKQIGMASGASYVLVAEAALYDVSSIIITAKLLDVETFGIKSSTVLVSGISANDMSYSCSVLAARLLGTKEPAPRANSTSVAQQPQAQSAADASPSAPSSCEFCDTAVSMPDGTTLYITRSPSTTWLNPSIFGDSQEKALEGCACQGEGWRLPTPQEAEYIYRMVDNKGIKEKNRWLAKLNICFSCSRWYWTNERGVGINNEYFRKGGAVNTGLNPKGKALYYCVKEQK